ncbi:unnamed protein product [Blepharisma stoltei]|uniref:non-specific serine/threonine protein kinase n=1 Tax=Blepharisma stoltei TaxID=1481888 RepID=A0AAU9JPR1_9CILI|nr:unnamed protein product [Blepharisma stoltei]
MGNCNLRMDNYDPTVSLNRQNFQFHYPIGKGGFGKVWKVTQKKSKTTYALKEMLKSRIIAKRSAHSVMNERRLLAILRHPFIVNMHYAFQDRENLYLVMDLMPGGDLRYHLSKVHKFSEEQTKFFVACLVIAFEYLHKNNIIHRDIKPENIVLDDLGYAHLTDFGIARVFQPENSNETSGTPGYMAPEVLCRQNHGFAVDYFALGVLGFEFMTGRRPYLGKDRKEIRDAILARQVQLKRSDIPEGWSLEAADFINKLIQRKPQNRLGSLGVEEVKEHAWLRDVQWEKLFDKNLNPPYKPPVADNFDSRQVMNGWKDEISSSTKEASNQGLFNGYFYDLNLQSEGVNYTTDTSKIEKKI